MAAKTYFCYGIPVTNESITLATLAYEKLEGPIRFIRLVQRRIREGTLQTAQNSAVGSMPIELWDLVRHKVTDVELRDAEIKFLNQHACEHCLLSCECSSDCYSGPPEVWAELLDCDVCTSAMIDYRGLGDCGLAKMRGARNSTCT